MADHGLKYGVYLPPFGPLGDPVVLVNLAVRAEAAGWDGVFLWDHVAPDNGFAIADSLVSLGAMAQATERVRLGTMVTPLPRRRPWVVARQAATVSRLSWGRFILGVGLGVDEFGDFSRFADATDPAVRAARLDEGIDVLKAIWSGRAYQHKGQCYQIALDESEPTPYPIPVWVASSGRSTRVAHRAARCGGIFPNPVDKQLTPADVADVLSAVHAAGLPAGQRFDVAIRRHVDEPGLGKPHPPMKFADLAAAGLTWWMEGLIHYDDLDYSMRIVDAGPPES